MIKFKMILLSLLSVSFLSCSSDDESESKSYKSLSASQKRELKKFSQSVNDLGSATTGKSKIKNQALSQKSILNGFDSTSSTVKTKAIYESRKEKINYLESELETCAFNSNIDDLLNPDVNSQPINQEDLLRRLEQGIYFNVTGDTCPLGLAFSGQMVINRKSAKVNGNFGLELEIKDDKISQISRIKSAKLSGSLSGQGSSSGSVISFNFKGGILHLDKGNVVIEISGNQKQSQSSENSYAVINYRFLDFTAVGEIFINKNMQTGEAQEAYKINGESVEAQTFMDYFAGQLEPENKEPGKIGGNNPIDGGDYPDVGISFYKPFLTFTK